MEIDARQRGPMLVGALIGALLGAGAAFMLTQEIEDVDEEKEPVRAKDVLSLTQGLVRALQTADDIRRRL